MDLRHPLQIPAGNRSPEADGPGGPGGSPWQARCALATNSGASNLSAGMKGIPRSGLPQHKNKPSVCLHSSLHPWCLVEPDHR